MRRIVAAVLLTLSAAVALSGCNPETGKAASGSSSCRTYTVKKGDTLSQIAEAELKRQGKLKYGRNNDQADLQFVNNMANTQVAADRKLKLPPAGSQSCK